MPDLSFRFYVSTTLPPTHSSHRSLQTPSGLHSGVGRVGTIRTGRSFFFKTKEPAKRYRPGVKGPACGCQQAKMELCKVMERQALCRRSGWSFSPFAVETMASEAARRIICCRSSLQFGPTATAAPKAKPPCCAVQDCGLRCCVDRRGNWNECLNQQCGGLVCRLPVQASWPCSQSSTLPLLAL